MRLSKGQPAPLFCVRDVAGRAVDLASHRGKHTLVAFHRFASCPFCNFRVHQLKTRFESLHSRGLEVIAFFESSDDNINKGVAKIAPMPFALVGDPQREVYRSYQVETSLLGMFKGRAGQRAGWEQAQKLGLLAEGVPREGAMSRIPADFLVGPDLRIALPHYGRDSADHLSFEAIEAWLDAVLPR